MTQQDEIDILDQHLKGVNLNVLKALVITTGVAVATVLSTYYKFSNKQEK